MSLSALLKIMRSTALDFGHRANSRLDHLPKDLPGENIESLTLLDFPVTHIQHSQQHARTWASLPHPECVVKICSCKHARVLQELVVGSDNNAINASDKCVANQHTARVHVQDSSSPWKYEGQA